MGELEANRPCMRGVQEQSGVHVWPGRGQPKVEGVARAMETSNTTPGVWASTCSWETADRFLSGKMIYSDLQFE